MHWVNWTIVVTYLTWVVWVEASLVPEKNGSPLGLPRPVFKISPMPPVIDVDMLQTGTNILRGTQTRMRPSHGLRWRS